MPALPNGGEERGEGVAAAAEAEILTGEEGAWCLFLSLDVTAYCADNDVSKPVVLVDGDFSADRASVAALPDEVASSAAATVQPFFFLDEVELG